mgnify:CR=1 FL=1
MWYGGGIGNNRKRSFATLGHLNRTGLYIPKNANTMSTTVNVQAKDYLKTLQRNPNEPKKFFIPIEFDSYQDIAYTIQNITNTCLNYLYAKENGMLLNENFFDLIKLLEIQKQIIPFMEFELLDKLNE